MGGIMLWRALRRRCPLCGASDIFATWGELRERCPGCDYSFEREEGYWVGAMIVNVGLVQVVIMAVLVGGFAATWPDVPWTLLTVTLGALAIGVPLWFYPRSKTVWIWLDLRIHPYSREERPDRR
jgi:uncharacterized protein (DUF983 family)